MTQEPTPPNSHPDRAPARRRLGVIGTFVWDVIYGCPPESARVEGWGGIAYALSGLDAALADDWEIVPIIKVGADVAAQAVEFLGTLRHLAPDASLVTVPEPNNRSELRYFTEERRSEFLSGGVPGWTWDELGPRLADARLDALYVNFLSGWELDLPTAQRVRGAFAGPIYVDLHMLMWEAQASGLRFLRPLADPEGWYRCFDLVQVNEDEMHTLAPDAETLARAAIGAGVLGTVVTLGRQGVASFAAPGFEALGDPARVEALRERVRAARAAGEPTRTALVQPQSVREGPAIDPTGCGDVWGSTYFSKLLAGHRAADAMRAANRAAGANVEFRGATGLVAHLSTEPSIR